MTYPSCTLVSVLLSGIMLFALSGVASAQIIYGDQETQVHGLPSVTAKSQAPTNVLSAALAIAFNNQDICCGKDSALEDSFEAADPASLTDIASKLNGKHMLSDGRAFFINAGYRPASAIVASDLIAAVSNQHPVLFLWNDQLYVLYGVTYAWYEITSGPEGGVTQANSIRKLLLVDPRFSDSRRSVVFDRATDDWNKVQGVLFLRATPE